METTPQNKVECATVVIGHRKGMTITLICTIINTALGIAGFHYKRKQ